MLGFFKIKNLRSIIIIYWILLAYIIAALIYWFILLNNQNDILTGFNKQKAITTDQLKDVLARNHRKQIQYIAEGSTFLLLIITGAIFVFRAVRRQLKMSQQQHNFMIALTHELKTPISVTKLNLETLQKRALTPEIQQKLISNTLQEANRLNDLCSNMLLASQLEAGGYRVTYELHDLSQLILECISEYHNRFPLRTFNTDIASEIYLNSDKVLIKIVINNLVDNAIKYSKADTPIVVSLKKNTSGIQIQITDEGNGIPDNEKEKVFRKFYRLGNQHTREAKGTGLGLYLSRTIIAQNKGTIVIKDNQPTGSIFTIQFPQTQLA